jgi:hypothetical protein
VTETDHVTDAANGFAGTFYQNDATVSWHVDSDRPAGGGHFSFTGDPSNSANSNAIVPGTAFVQLATEQNGVFFPSGASLQHDPVHPALTNLVVNGSSTGGVHIQLTSVHSGQDVRVQITGAEQSYQADFPAAAISHLIVNSGPGGNQIAIANNVRQPALLLGSFGNDHIVGGGGSTIIIGGLGSDHLQAGSGGALLIGGTTDFDRDPPGLYGLLTEWARTDESYAQKVANLSILNAATVHDDGAGNLLEGGAGLDWFFANLDGVGNHGVLDRVTGRKPGEILTGITL